LNKEFGKARVMTNILARQSVEMRTTAETMLQQAGRLLCESWNERMWADGEPIDPSPTIDQAVRLDAVDRGFESRFRPVRYVV
jgi:hypothetical protein